jgi:hypothetical protein
MNNYKKSAIDIAKDAGGKVTNLFGDEQLYNQEIKGAIISNNVMHDKLIDVVQKSETKIK